MLALSKIVSYSNKILLTFFLEILPEVLKLLTLAICVIWKHYKLIKSRYGFRSAVKSKTSKFICKATDQDLGECSICLSGFEEGEEGQELLDCKHCFHRRCVEKWLLKEQTAATCPLCRSPVVPQVVLAEYQKMEMEQKDDVIEKELALVLLTAFDHGICNGFSF